MEEVAGFGNSYPHTATSYKLQLQAVHREDSQDHQVQLHCQGEQGE